MAHAADKVKFLHFGLIMSNPQQLWGSTNYKLISGLPSVINIWHRFFSSIYYFTMLPNKLTCPSTLTSCSKVGGVKDLQQQCKTNRNKLVCFIINVDCLNYTRKFHSTVQSCSDSLAGLGHYIIKLLESLLFLVL